MANPQPSTETIIYFPYRHFDKIYKNAANDQHFLVATDAALHIAQLHNAVFQSLAEAEKVRSQWQGNSAIVSAKLPEDAFLPALPENTASLPRIKKEFTLLPQHILSVALTPTLTQELSKKVNKKLKAHFTHIEPASEKSKNAFIFWQQPPSAKKTSPQQKTEGPSSPKPKK